MDYNIRPQTWFINLFQMDVYLFEYYGFLTNPRITTGSFKLRLFFVNIIIINKYRVHIQYRKLWD